MALWFLCTLLFTIFSGLYFAYDAQRMNPSEDYQTQAAGLFDACRKGAVLEATANPGMGGAHTCDSLSLPAAATQGLNVPGVNIWVQAATLLNPGAPGRIVITYVAPGGNVMGIPQLTAKAQIIKTFRTEVSTGNVAAGGPYNIIQNGSSEVARLPAAVVPVDSIASVDIVNP